MADDDPDDQYLVKKAIEESEISHSFTALDNGLQLMDLLLCRGSFARAMGPLPDCILLDWNMPVMSGIEFLEALRALEGANQPKVIFCSRHNEMKYIVQALEAGADEYIMKPFDGDILKFKLSRAGLL